MIQRTDYGRRLAWQASMLLGCSTRYAEVSSLWFAAHLTREVERLLADKWERLLPRAEEEARRVELFRTAAYNDGRERGYRDGYARRSDEFTKLIDPGDREDTVWLTPKPEHDVLRVAPPLAVPCSRIWESQLRPVNMLALTFRARTIAECYDGVTYRQVLWERSR